MTPFNVMIVDDQNMARLLFESYIKNDPRYHLVYALDTAELADIYTAKFKIDLIIMDVVMKTGISGLDAAERIKKNSPDTKIIIVTSMPEVSYIDRARVIGVEGFWYKELEQEALLSVCDRVMAGETVYPEKTPAVKLGFADSSEFTEREFAVLRELTTGCSDQEIAERLNISYNTVRSHISHMLDKTGFTSRTALAIQARISGLVIPET